MMRFERRGGHKRIVARGEPEQETGVTPAASADFAENCRPRCPTASGLSGDFHVAAQRPRGSASCRGANRGCASTFSGIAEVFSGARVISARLAKSHFATLRARGDPHMSHCPMGAMEVPLGQRTDVGAARPLGRTAVNAWVGRNLPDAAVVRCLSTKCPGRCCSEHDGRGNEERT